MTGREIIFIAALAVTGTALYFHFREGPPAADEPEEEVGDTMDRDQQNDPPDDSAADIQPALQSDTEQDELFERLPGLYIQLSEGSKTETGHLLFITADLELYKLARSQVKYVREYIGSVDPDMFRLSADGSFSFYDYHGRKPAPGEDIPMAGQLTMLLKINELAKTLMKELNRRDIELSVRLDRDRPQFTEKQASLLEQLVQKPGDLALFMQEQGIETLWINDYLNERLYISDGYLVIPAALKEDIGTVVRKIADRSYEPENMDL